MKPTKSLMLHNTRQVAAKLTDAIKIAEQLIEPMLLEPVDPNAVEIIELGRSLRELEQRLNDLSENDLATLQAVRQHRIEHFEYIIKALRLSIELLPSPVVDGVASELEEVFRKMSCRIAPEVGPDTVINDELIWENPWNRREAARAFKYWLGFMDDDVVEDAMMNRPLVGTAVIALIELRGYYLED